METSTSRLEAVQKRYTELLQDMKRTERDHIKAKKRGDQLQKEKDAQKTEMNKVVAMKDKLEKLSRDLTKENKKLKVRISCEPCAPPYTNICHRKMCREYR